MMRTGFSLALLVALTGFFGCSSSLGSGWDDLPKEGVSAPISCGDPLDPRPTQECPNLPTLGPLTALEALANLEEVAQAALGTASQWSGWISGIGIGTDGTLDVSDKSGFATTWCDGENELLFDTTSGLCRARNACDCAVKDTCRKQCTKPFEFPKIDSRDAIVAAFGEDSAGAEGGTFEILYDGSVGDWWSVRRTGDENWVLVDGTTGALLAAD